MKFLIIPGLPLLTIALALRDADSPAAVITYLVSLYLLLLGGVFVLIYAVNRLVSRPR